ncbi:hypothetical protein LTR80_011933, partial [Exophiala xenobiotica]
PCQPCLLSQIPCDFGADKRRRLPYTTLQFTLGSLLQSIKYNSSQKLQQFIDAIRNDRPATDVARAFQNNIQALSCGGYLERAEIVSDTEIISIALEIPTHGSYTGQALSTAPSSPAFEHRGTHSDCVVADPSYGGHTTGGTGIALDENPSTLALATVSYPSFPQSVPGLYPLDIGALSSFEPGPGSSWDWVGCSNKDTMFSFPVSAALDSDTLQDCPSGQCILPMSFDYQT